jgi:hypothetical protein
MPFFGIPNPIKGIRNKLMKAFSNPEKSLFQALAAQDEEKALEVYTMSTDTKNPPLIETFDPSARGTIRQYEGETGL